MGTAKLRGNLEGPGREDKNTLAHKRPLKGTFHFLILGRRWRSDNRNGLNRPGIFGGSNF